VIREAVLTFDLEDWFQLVGRRFGMSAGRVTRGRLQSQVATILDLLARHQARATFFVLGMTAESCPQVVRDVQAAGHEIGSHGFGHQLVKTLTPDAFRADIVRSVAVLRDLAGVEPRGYRAPEFSIDRSCFWAFDVLLDQGFHYDSSIYPFGGRRYGIPDFSLEPTAVTTPSGRTINELPLAVVELFGRRVPVAGGGYWRLLPAPALTWATRRLASARSPMLYFHPAEFDERTLNTPLPNARVARFVLAQNLGRRSIAAKLETLLTERRAIGAAEFLAGRPAAAAAVA
jgi:polysaccharide deacetylase family protein (PEP-CTERM system associated)